MVIRNQEGVRTVFAYLRKWHVTKTTTMQIKMMARFSSLELELRQRACVNLKKVTCSASFFFRAKKLIITHFRITRKIFVIFKKASLKSIYTKKLQNKVTLLLSDYSLRVT